MPPMPIPESPPPAAGGDSNEMDFMENKGTKLFQDSIHEGQMKFPKLIVKIIDTREFQRLRNIKQLSTTYLVFPAAAHNRFEHCLGVCWLASKLLDHLETSSPNNWKRILPNEEEAKKIKLAVQVAALLHDVGHGPFSHTWENFVAASGKQWDHESTSCKIIDLMVWQDGKKCDENLTKLGKEFKEEFDDVQTYVNFIQEVIKGKDPANEPPTMRSFLYQIVSNKSNDIDVDKFDYFVRDAQHLKIGISFDHWRLMNLSSIKIENGASHIGYRDVARSDIERMFQVRADLHFQAYQHRVAKCLEAMLIDGLKEADRKGFKVGGGRLLSEVHKDPKQFLKLTDSIQETILNSEDSNYEGAREIFNRIVTRDLYELVGEWTLNVSQSVEDERDNKPPAGLKNEMVLELEDILEQKFAISQVRVNKGKYYDPIREIRFYSKEGVQRDYKEWEERMPGCHRTSLPFYKVYIFKRNHEDVNLEEVKKKVQDFLVERELLLI